MAGRRNTIAIPMPATNQEDVRVNVMKVTQDHEVLDINGFKIKRRKTEAPTAAAPPLAGALRTPYEQAERVSTASQRTPNVEEYEISAELYDRLSRGLRALPETAAPQDRLAAVCEAVCGAGVDIAAKERGPDVAAALNVVFGSFLVGARAAAGGGAVQFADPPTGMELRPADLKVDLEARKAGLRNRLQMLKEEEKEWHELLARVEALEVGPSGATDADEPADADPGTAAERYAGRELAAVRAISASAHRELTMQVDGLCALVGDMEDVVDGARERAAAAQAAHRDRMFQPFTHVNSPARLIKGILAGPPSPVEGEATEPVPVPAPAEGEQQEQALQQGEQDVMPVT